MADQTVALTGDPVLDLAGGGDFEALLHTALGLQLGHFRLLARDDRGRPRQPTLAGPSHMLSRKRRAISRAAGQGKPGNRPLQPMVFNRLWPTPAPSWGTARGSSRRGVRQPLPL